MKKLFSLLLVLSLCSAALSGCGQKQTETDSTAADRWPDAVSIELADSGITVDGETVSEDASAAVYTANDIIYYEDRDAYDSGNAEGEGTDEDKDGGFRWDAEEPEDRCAETADPFNAAGGPEHGYGGQQDHQWRNDGTQQLQSLGGAIQHQTVRIFLLSQCQCGGDKQ